MAGRWWWQGSATIYGDPDESHARTRHGPGDVHRPARVAPSTRGERGVRAGGRDPECDDRAVTAGAASRAWGIRAASGGDRRRWASTRRGAADHRLRAHPGAGDGAGV